jgi:potassium-transporting ATPase potassium-binding subunit
MGAADWIETILFVCCLFILSPILGRYIFLVYEGRQTVLSPFLSWLEKGSLYLLRIDPKPMNWREYALGILYFNLCGFFLLFFLLLFQHLLPLNPQNFKGLSWPDAFNIAVSATTGTGWQSYAPELTLSYFSQMVGLTPQSFASAATGMTVAVALARGITSKMTGLIGNFWVDLVRTLVYFLLPFSLILAIFMISQGVIQNFNPYLEVTNLEGSHQIIPFGPVASQTAINQIGGSGGSFFDASNTHPYENPTRISNFLQNLAMILIPGSMPFAFGYLVHSRRHGYLLFILMIFLWGLGFSLARFSEASPNEFLGTAHTLEGKELRFGITRSLLWSTSTTATNNGGVNSVLESLTPFAGGVCLFNMLTKEVIFGGVGVGICGMIIFSLITLFFAGILIGRTCEYLEKRVDSNELRWSLFSLLIPATVILLGTSLSFILPNALQQIQNIGPHTLLEVVYAFASCANNNGSSLAGLNTHSFYYQITLSVAMILGRIAMLLPPLVIAGSFAEKRRIPSHARRISVNSKTFLVLLGGVIILITLLIYLPTLILGPFFEEILMKSQNSL